jgi:hypothetical protein
MSVRCGRPLGLAALLDYWLDREPPDDAVEEHLLACDSCSGRLQELVSLGDGVRRLAREGVVAMVVTPSFLARAAQEGLQTREYRVPPGGRVDCTVTREDDLLVGRLQGDFRGMTRLDVVAATEGGTELRIEDVPIGPEATELIVAQAMPAMRLLGRSRHRYRLLAHDPGGDRLIGEYTFDHTPSPD